MELATQFDSDPEHHRIIEALASDDRMEVVWDKVGGRPDLSIEILTRSAFLYATAVFLADLVQPPEKRAGLGRGCFELSSYAKDFADALEKNRALSNEFWPEPLENLLPKLREFSKQLHDRWFALWSSLEAIPAPNRRGPGDRQQIAYSNAIASDLEKIGGLTRERQDELVAALTSVVFGQDVSKEVKAETIRTRRQRKSRAIRSGEGDKSGA
jgi:hypothetical protein